MLEFQRIIYYSDKPALLKSTYGGQSKIYAGLYNGTPVQIYPVSVDVDPKILQCLYKLGNGTGLNDISTPINWSVTTHLTQKYDNTNKKYVYCNAGEYFDITVSLSVEQNSIIPNASSVYHNSGSPTFSGQSTSPTSNTICVMPNEISTELLSGDDFFEISVFTNSTFTGYNNAIIVSVPHVLTSGLYTGTKRVTVVSTSNMSFGRAAWEFFC